MSLNKEQVIKILNDNSRRVRVGIDQYDAVTDVDYDYVAGQILSLLQPNSDMALPLQQADVNGSLALLEQECNRLNDADPTTMNSHENLKRVIRKGHCDLAMRLIKELSANDRQR